MLGRSMHFLDCINKKDIDSAFVLVMGENVTPCILFYHMPNQGNVS